MIFDSKQILPARIYKSDLDDLKDDNEMASSNIIIIWIEYILKISGKADEFAFIDIGFSTAIEDRIDKRNLAFKKAKFVDYSDAFLTAEFDPIPITTFEKGAQYLIIPLARHSHFTMAIFERKTGNVFFYDSLRLGLKDSHRKCIEIAVRTFYRLVEREEKIVEQPPTLYYHEKTDIDLQTGS